MSNPTFEDHDFGDLNREIASLRFELGEVTRRLKAADDRIEQLNQRVVSVTDALAHFEAISEKEELLRDIMVGALRAQSELQQGLTIITTTASELISEKTAVIKSLSVVWKRWRDESLAAVGTS